MCIKRERERVTVYERLYNGEKQTSKTNNVRLFGSLRSFVLLSLTGTWH